MNDFQDRYEADPFDASISGAVAVRTSGQPALHGSFWSVWTPASVTKLWNHMKPSNDELSQEQNSFTKIQSKLVSHEFAATRLEHITTQLSENDQISRWKFREPDWNLGCQVLLSLIMIIIVKQYCCPQHLQNKGLWSSTSQWVNELGLECWGGLEEIGTCHCCQSIIYFWILWSLFANTLLVPFRLVWRLTQHKMQKIIDGEEAKYRHSFQSRALLLGALNQRSLEDRLQLIRLDWFCF